MTHLLVIAGERRAVGDFAIEVDMVNFIGIPISIRRDVGGEESRVFNHGAGAFFLMLKGGKPRLMKKKKMEKIWTVKSSEHPYLVCEEKYH